MESVNSLKRNILKAFKTRTNSAPCIIAELSGNHNQSINRLLRLVDAAAACGVDAIKLQTYTADTITLNIPAKQFVVRKKGSPWNGRKLHSLYHEAHTPWDWHAPVIERAKSHGLAWFSSPFDFTAVDFLERLRAPCYKIASPEIVDLPLIKRCAATGKPLILSTGMASGAEIAEAVHTAKRFGAKKIILLKCTTDYPARPEDANLRALRTLAEKFKCPVGLSDHTLGTAVAVAATALGAVLIEKHLTLCREDGGPDAAFSLEPKEMKILVRECRMAWKSLGAAILGPTKNEKDYLKGRRSLYIVKDIKAGSVLTEEIVKSIRPSHGLKPKYFYKILGKKVRKTVKKGTPLSWSLLKKDN